MNATSILNEIAVCSDNSWGPVVEGQCRGGFDFTLLFEESLLSIGPSTVLLLAIPLRILQLYRRNRKVGWSYLHNLKLVSLADDSSESLAANVLLTLDFPAIYRPAS
jgi:hypothetical protein